MTSQIKKHLNVHFTNNSNEWGTPDELFNELNKEFNFNLDPCSNGENAKCKKYFTKNDNGLTYSWGGYSVFMNPPYGREIKNWVEKAYKESLKPNTTVVCLIPARTDTTYWHNYIFGKAKDIRFLKGRVKFVNPTGGKSDAAPFPSAVIVFK